MPKTAPMNEVDRHIGRQIRKARRAKRMSQEALGKSLGISFQQIQKYEEGTNRISFHRAWELCGILGVEFSFFFDGLDPTVLDARPRVRW